MTLNKFVEDIQVEYNNVSNLILFKLKRYDLLEEMQVTDIVYNCGISFYYDNVPSNYKINSPVLTSIDMSMNPNTLEESLNRNKGYVNMNRYVGKANINLNIFHKHLKMSDNLEKLKFPFDIFDEALLQVLGKYGFEDKYFKSPTLTGFSKTIKF